MSAKTIPLLQPTERMSFSEEPTQRLLPGPVWPISRVRVISDLAYVPGGGARNRLDLYLPEQGPFPVALFVHGGSWCSGDKAMYAHIGTFFAQHGIGAVLMNYRLSPAVRHPAHVQDVAAAFAWTQRHLGRFGGDPARLFLVGHSAGGHLVALLATDDSYLRPLGLSPAQVRGVIAVSGVYQINFNVTLHGAGHVFRVGDRWAASPLHHIKPECPPFLLFHAGRDLWTLAGQARKMHARLRARGVWSVLQAVPGLDHSSILHRAVLPEATHGRALVEFLLRH
jgi:acetyl esterase/lipase